MALTYQSVIDRLVMTVQRDELLPNYLGIVNDAIREMAILHSFEQMKATGTGTVTSPGTLASLPADFKEFQDGRFPIFDSVPAALVPVYSRKEVEKLLPLGLIPPQAFIYTQDFTGGTAAFSCNLAIPSTQNHTLTVYYYAYPPIATDPTTTTPLITYYFNLVKLKAFSIAFESINDPVYLMHEKQFLQEFMEKTGVDLSTQISALTEKKG